MKNFLKTMWKARLPVHNRLTVTLGVLFLIAAAFLTIQYYSGH